MNYDGSILVLLSLTPGYQQVKSTLEFTSAAAAPEEGGGDEDNKEGAGARATVGEVGISMWILTQAEADAGPVGLARNEPNVNPQLITPLEGRGWGDVLAGFAFSLPDFGLLGKLLPIIIVCFLILIALKWMGLL